MEPIQLGKYRLLQLLATGGMGEVFLAKNEGPAGFSKTLVVKRILSHLAADPNFVAMFLDEARLAAQLSHPNIVQIFELGQEGTTYFIAMELVNGRSLKAIKQQLAVRSQVLSPVVAARVMSLALQGLHYAHTLCDEEGNALHIVHRDISPDNVLVTFSGEVKVVDFGIAKASNAVTTTRTGTLKGKYGYMAPEQLMAEKVDARADVYSSGVVLYEVVTGVRPFRAATEPALIQAILQTEARAPHELNPEVPRALSEIILKALSKRPSDCYDSAEQMSLVLEEFVHTHKPPLASSHVAALLRMVFPEGPLATTTSGPMLPPSSRIAVTKEVDVAEEADGQFPSGGSTSSPSLIKSAPANVALLQESNTTLAESGRGDGGRAKSVWLAAAGGALVGLLVAGGVLLFRSDARDGGARGASARVDAGALRRDERPTSEPIPVVEARPVKPPEVQVVDAGAVAAEIPERPTPVVTKRPPDRRAPVNRTGKVSLRINPWAEVFFGGKSLGITPMPPVEVPAGVQTFTLKNPELKVSRQVQVRVPSGGTTVLKADLFD